ncbi:hypothetical protein Mapa_012641 [Marchantia paleacea]|nr:hypothetical protein Mapa_012641 [Marchantia paleacea]
MVKLSETASFTALCAAFAVTLSMVTAPADAQLKPEFYVQTCPQLPTIVQQQVQAAIKKEARMAASLLRLHFHDCFVQGCDASILLDDDSRLPLGEKTAAPNLNSVRGFEVIDAIKSAVEKQCPKIVSCADILALASSISVRLSGGPKWFVPLGRRDSLTGNFSAALEFLPGPTSTVTDLKQKFSNVGLNVVDLVALSGGHTIGLSRCISIITRLYNFNGGGGADPTIEAQLLATLKKTCPNGGDGNVTTPLDPTPSVFDNRYFKELQIFKGVLNSDEVLFTQATDTKGLVNLYSQNETMFMADFTASMIKMGNMKPLTGNSGEIRLNCRKPNSLLLQDMEPLIELVSDI